MSTDTAFALGALSLVGPRYADRLRAYIVAVLVFDDLASLIVIAVVYSERISVMPLLVAIGIFAEISARAAGARVGLVFLVLGVAMWAAVLASGIDPLVVGLATGLLAYASPAGRTTLEQASRQFRRFREQPTGSLARRARASLEGGGVAERPAGRPVAPVDSYLVVPCSLWPTQVSGHRSDAVGGRPFPGHARNRDRSWSASRSRSQSPPIWWPGCPADA